MELLDDIMVEYTPYESEVIYSGQYPDMIEFTNLCETSIQVEQGQGKISKYGEPLQSRGFSKCFGLIIRNQLNLESALFHVDDIDLTHTHTPVVGELLRKYVDSLNIDSFERKSLFDAMDEIIHYGLPEFDGGMKRKEFQSRMEELNENGIIQARIIRGDNSHDVKNRIVGSLLGYLGIPVVEDLIVNTGRKHWAVVYKPNESKIYIDVRDQKKLLKFNF